MEVLLDSHCLIWALDDPAKPPPFPAVPARCLPIPAEHASVQYLSLSRRNRPTR